MWIDFWNTTNVGSLKCIKWWYFNVLNAYVYTIRAITMQASILSQKGSISHKGEQRPHLYENTFTVYIWFNIELPKFPLNSLTPIKQSYPASKTTWVNSVWHAMGWCSRCCTLEWRQLDSLVSFTYRNLETSPLIT